MGASSRELQGLRRPTHGLPRTVLHAAVLAVSLQDSLCEILLSNKPLMYSSPGSFFCLEAGQQQGLQALRGAAQ